MLDRPGDLGTSITGGWRYPVAAGDVLRIPAGTPHAYLAPDGGHVTYVLVRVPAFVGEVVEVPDGEGASAGPSGIRACGNLRSWKSGIEPSGPGWGRMIPLARRLPTTAKVASLTAFDSFAGMGTDGPELHEDIIDVVFVQSGAGTLLVGGEMIGQSNAPGSRINGGSRHPVAAGDVLHIPARTPHAYLVPDGGHITYVLVRVPAHSKARRARRAARAAGLSRGAYAAVTARCGSFNKARLGFLLGPGLCPCARR